MLEKLLGRPPIRVCMSMACWPARAAAAEQRRVASPPVRFCDMTLGAEPPYLVKGLIPREGLAVV